MENLCENYNTIKTNTHSSACKPRTTLKINHDTQKKKKLLKENMFGKRETKIVWKTEQLFSM